MVSSGPEGAPTAEKDKRAVEIRRGMHGFTIVVVGTFQKYKSKKVAGKGGGCPSAGRSNGIWSSCAGRLGHVAAERVHTVREHRIHTKAIKAERAEDWPTLETDSGLSVSTVSPLKSCVSGALARNVVWKSTGLLRRIVASHGEAGSVILSYHLTENEDRIRGFIFSNFSELITAATTVIFMRMYFLTLFFDRSGDESRAV